MAGKKARRKRRREANMEQNESTDNADAARTDNICVNNPSDITHILSTYYVEFIQQVHYTYWHIPIWSRKSSSDTYQLTYENIICWEILPCSVMFLHNLPNIYYPNEIWLLSEAVLIKCSGCWGCLSGNA